MKKFVDVESPYMAETEEKQRKNLLYARACIRDCLLRGEIPFCSHLFYTQPGILDDNIPEEREKGINVGKELMKAIPETITVVYTDLGISEGMQYGINKAKEKGQKIEHRKLEENWEERESKIAKKHSHAKIWGFF